MSGAHVSPRAWTSAPPSASFPSHKGAKPSLVAKALTGAGRVLVVAGQEHDPPATLHIRVGAHRLGSPREFLETVQRQTLAIKSAGFR